MRYIIIFLLLTSGLHAQIKSTIILGPGEGGPVSGPADSMGLVIPLGELVIGTGSKAPGSSDSLFWNAGLFVDAPVNFSALVAGAVDSLLYIDASGFIGKTAVVVNTNTNIANTNLTADASRILNMGGFDLDIVNADVFSVTAGGTFVMQGGTTYLSGTSLVDIIAPMVTIDAPDIFLEDALTLSTWDSILVRNPVTGEIQARLSSTLRDSLGRNGTAGQIVFETATKAPNSSANLFWDNSANRFGVNTTPGMTVDIVLAASGADGLRITRPADLGASFRLLNTNGHWVFNVLPSSSGNSFSIVDQANLVNAIYVTAATRNFGMGTNTFGTSAAGVLGILNGTEPTTSPANMVQLWAFDVAASSELRVRDEASNVTTLSPHSFTQVKPSHPMAWAFRSHNDVLGLEINVDMFRVVQLLEELTGEKLIHIKSIK